LTAVDRTGSETVEITHESLGAVLGVLRPVVTKAALELQDASAVRNRRGRISVLNRRMLELSACECYRLLSIKGSAPYATDSSMRQVPHGNDDDTVTGVTDLTST
jgi:hypothetical protein